MQQCKHCYRAYEDGVEICDCGRPLVQQTASWLQRKLRDHLSPPCPQCGQPRLEELTAENRRAQIIKAWPAAARIIPHISHTILWDSCGINVG